MEPAVLLQLVKCLVLNFKTLGNKYKTHSRAVTRAVTETHNPNSPLNNSTGSFQGKLQDPVVSPAASGLAKHEPAEGGLHDRN